MTAPVLCLGSASPRRAELLRQLGVPHIVVPSDADETRRVDEPPSDYVLRLACSKAAGVLVAAAGRIGGLPVLAADTSVVIDDQVLGKPLDAAECREMLGRLSGREHEVFTAVALASGGATRTRLSRSRVIFRRLGEAEMDAYWATGEPRDKAGGYAVQGYGAAFVRRLEGSYSGVVGLPLFETAELLAEAGVPVWREGA
jgi:septum formation protein